MDPAVGSPARLAWVLMTCEIRLGMAHMTMSGRFDPLIGEAVTA